MGARGRRLRLPGSAVLVGRAARAQVGRAGGRRRRARGWRRATPPRRSSGSGAPTFNEGVDRMRRLVCEYYDGFSFGQMIRQYPEMRGTITDLLIGDLFDGRVDKVWTPLESLYPPTRPCRCRGTRARRRPPCPKRRTSWPCPRAIDPKTVGVQPDRGARLQSAAWASRAPGLALASSPAGRCSARCAASPGSPPSSPTWPPASCWGRRCSDGWRRRPRRPAFSSRRRRAADPGRPGGCGHLHVPGRGWSSTSSARARSCDRSLGSRSQASPCPWRWARCSRSGSTEG